MLVGPTNFQRAAASCGSDCLGGHGERGCLRASFFQGAGRDPAVSHALGDEPVLRWALFASVLSLVRLAPLPVALADPSSETSWNDAATSSRIARSARIRETWALHRSAIHSGAI